MFSRVFQHLLPTGEAFKGGINLRAFFDALAAVADDIRLAAEQAFTEIDPAHTTQLAKYVSQFGLWPGSNSTQLAAAWRATGGQSKTYLQETLRAQGFDVYVHDWWVPGTEPTIGSHACATPRNPATYLTSTGYIGLVQAGEQVMQAGEPLAQAGQTLAVGGGYLLVDRLRVTVSNYHIQAGEPLAQAGEPLAQAGESDGAHEVYVDHILPTDSELWRYFAYIGGATFPNVATVPLVRRAEFEQLLLKYFPAHLWLGVMVHYE